MSRWMNGEAHMVCAYVDTYNHSEKKEDYSEEQISMLSEKMNREEKYSMIC